jgi:hypothetical protein
MPLCHGLKSWSSSIPVTAGVGKDKQARPLLDLNIQQVSFFSMNKVYHVPGSSVVVENL